MAEPLPKYLITVVIKYTYDPTVSRLLSVPVNLTFGELHEAIQVAFGWTNSHMSRFDVQGLDDDGNIQRDRHLEIETHDQPWRDEELGEILEDEALTDNSGLSYEYDFGDSWDHAIMSEGKGLGTRSVPMCIAGEGHGVAEDAGSTSANLHPLTVRGRAACAEFVRRSGGVGGSQGVLRCQEAGCGAEGADGVVREGGPEWGQKRPEEWSQMGLGQDCREPVASVDGLVDQASGQQRSSGQEGYAGEEWQSGQERRNWRRRSERPQNTRKEGIGWNKKAEVG